VVLAKQPTVVAGQAFTSGQILRTIDFEKSPAAARLMAGPMDSMCSPAHFAATKVETKPGELVTDMFWGEHATAYHVKDRGLVVITSCGHAGVINSVRHVQKVTAIDKVHAIVGGFHLSPAPDEIVAKTVEHRVVGYQRRTGCSRGGRLCGRARRVRREPRPRARVGLQADDRPCPHSVG
jgi:7,8-dihydropterin-6-yl-methyl-4-(beta-D-ribofuranosyl)aminobenzene 5'-phosphate synthase